MPRPHSPSTPIAAFAILGLLSFYAGAAEITPDANLRAAVAALKPGDELVLTGGVYQLQGGFRVTVRGSAQAPIVMRAKQGERVTIRQNSAAHNNMEIAGSEHFIVRGIEFIGGSHGIRLMDSDRITVEDCEIHGTGDVAISANASGVYEGLRLLRNHIHHTSGTGEGMYLGCHKNTCRVANSLIEGNYIHHTNGPNVEQGDGIEVKEGSYGNVIRDNVIHDTNYPGILTYSTVGNGPANVIEGNVIWNTRDFSIQSAADTVIRNNIILGSPIGLQNHEAGRPSNIQIVHNTIVAERDAIAVRNVAGPIVIANNAVYAPRGHAINLISGERGLVALAGNIGQGGIVGARTGYIEGKGMAADLIDVRQRVPPIDVFPKRGSALIGAGSPTYAIATDFNGAKRTIPVDAGAYRYNANGNPGWKIIAGFKGAKAASPPQSGEQGR